MNGDVVPCSCNISSFFLLLFHSIHPTNFNWQQFALMTSWNLICTMFPNARYVNALWKQRRNPLARARVGSLKIQKEREKKPHNHDHAIYYVEWRGYDLCCTEWEIFEWKFLNVVEISSSTHSWTMAILSDFDKCFALSCRARWACSLWHDLYVTIIFVLIHLSAIVTDLTTTQSPLAGASRNS